MVSLASTPEASGRTRFATGNTYEEMIARDAELRILEISPNAPYCFGQNYLDWDSIDYVIESEGRPGTIPAAASSDRDLIIGRTIADLVDDGDCIQVGIGGIPNAVCGYLYEKKDLGIHTEMMTTGIMDLMKAGVVTGARKQVDVGKTVFAFALGSAEMYEFIDKNPDCWTGRGEEVNNPYLIARNDNQVSINTSIEIDLTGQCCSESIGTQQISGTGGQSDTATGAQRSRNGRSIIALYSTRGEDRPGDRRDPGDLEDRAHAAARRRGVAVPQRRGLGRHRVRRGQPARHDDRRTGRAADLDRAPRLP